VVGDPALMISFDVEQTPDSEVDCEIEKLALVSYRKQSAEWLTQATPAVSCASGGLALFEVETMNN